MQFYQKLETKNNSAIHAVKIHQRKKACLIWDRTPPYNCPSAPAVHPHATVCAVVINVITCTLPELPQRAVDITEIRYQLLHI